MKSPFVRSFVVAVAVIAVFVAPVPSAAQGTVSGRVIDKATSQPIVGARVTIIGTAIIAQTNAEGRYTLGRVPAGDVTVRATAIGFGAGSRGVTVTDVGVTVEDLELELVARPICAERVSNRQEPASRAQNTQHLADRLRDVPHVVEGSIAADNIERLVFEGEDM